MPVHKQENLISHLTSSGPLTAIFIQNYSGGKPYSKKKKSILLRIVEKKPFCWSLINNFSSGEFPLFPFKEKVFSFWTNYVILHINTTADTTGIEGK